ncbi:MAG: response regulator [Candidatus Omnitrophica bacterium]|nr:response regulator [Candidatus Omnitrophota bacterium]
MPNKKILLVDDEVDFRELAKARLEANGYDVIAISNGKDAIKHVLEDKPDGVLLDIMMPGIDGLSILKEIRAKDPNLPVFLITAFSNTERREIARKFNASEFILKTDDLQAEIANMTTLIDIASKQKK